MAQSNLAFRRALASANKTTNRGRSSNNTRTTSSRTGSTNTAAVATAATAASAAAVHANTAEQARRARHSSGRDSDGGGGGRGDTATAILPGATVDDDQLDIKGKDIIPLSNGISAVRVHQLAVTLRPLSSGVSGRPTMSASRWEVRKALLSLCTTQPVMFEVRDCSGRCNMRLIEVSDGRFMSGPAGTTVAQGLFLYVQLCEVEALQLSAC